VPGATCRMDRYPLDVVLLWSDYYRLHKRGGISLMDLPPEYLDCLDAELYGEAEKARAARERKAQQDMLKLYGASL